MEKEFFSIKSYLKKLKLNLRKHNFILACVSPRNTGKSTSMIELLLEEYELYGHKFIYCRLRFQQIKKFRASFNSTYNGKYYASEHKIYKLVPKPATEDELNDPKYEPKYTRIEIATLVAVTTESSFKSSGGYEDYRYIFFDEFNDVSEVMYLYESFTNMVMTFQRYKPDFSIFMMGNKDNENSTFLVNWGIDSDVEDTGEDTVVIIEPPAELMQDDPRYKGIYYLNVSDATFKHLKGGSLSRALAYCNPTMDRYINHGGYRKIGEKNIINYKFYIEPSSRPLYNLAVNKMICEIGKFTNKYNKEAFYIRDCSNIEYNKDIPLYSNTGADGINLPSCRPMPDDYKRSIAKLLINSSKHSLLYFSSYESYLVFTTWLKVWTR